MTKLFSGQFCFVQVENGHVVEISYEQNSHPEGVNLKKSIAAAFQANFQNQEEEEEEDPQSLHVAHYRYIAIEFSAQEIIHELNVILNVIIVHAKHFACAYLLLKPPKAVGKFYIDIPSF